MERRRPMMTDDFARGRALHEAHEAITKRWFAVARGEEPLID